MGLRRWIVALMAAALLSTAGGVCAQDEVLRVADHDWPPFGFAGDDDSSHPPGIIREVVGACLEQAGHGAEFEFLPLNRLFRYLEEGRLDLNVMSRSSAREAFALYGRVPVFTSRYVPFVRVGDDVDIQAIGDFDGLRLGHLAGLRYSESFRDYVDRRSADGTVVTTPTQESLIQMLLADHIDVFVLPEESVAWRVKQEAIQGRLRSLDFVIRSSEYFVTVSKASERVPDGRALLDELDACMSGMRTDGRLHRIFAPYGLVP